LHVLGEASENKVATASLLGIGKRTFWTKLKKHGW
jgi:transcriptional regulator with PAS, ATPase and Fis domain